MNLGGKNPFGSLPNNVIQIRGMEYFSISNDYWHILTMLCHTTQKLEKHFESTENMWWKEERNVFKEQSSSFLLFLRKTRNFKNFPKQKF